MNRRYLSASVAGAVLAAAAALVFPVPGEAGEGITPTTIRIGSVLDLEGRSRGLGQGMKRGIEAAISGQSVAGRTIEFISLDDSYTPSKTIASTKAVLDRDVFAVIGNVGTPTAKVSLPILAENRVPAVGFFTGAGILRPGVGDIVNFRASYVQETAAVIEQAIAAGIEPREICAYVQNDAYGMAGVIGIKRALSSRSGTEAAVQALDAVLIQEGENPPRNGLGPVGVYQRNTFTSRSGYLSLKSWEQGQDTRCRLVVTVGTYNAIARFIGYSRYRGESWLVSAVSFTGADNFRQTLNDMHVDRGVLMTQVVPALDSDLPIVRQAREQLGEEFGYVSLEGFIVGKMWLQAMRAIKGPLTRQSFLKTVYGSSFDVGGLKLDFSDDNQGSDLVSLTYLDGAAWYPISDKVWLSLVEDGKARRAVAQQR